jgi:hypothetical protein
MHFAFFFFFNLLDNALLATNVFISLLIRITNFYFELFLHFLMFITLLVIFLHFY